MKKQNKADLQRQYDELKQAFLDIHWMARRYADGRRTYAVGMMNDATRTALAQGIDLPKPWFARDGSGRAFDGLSIEEYQEATELDPSPNMTRVLNKIYNGGSNDRQIIG